MKSTAYILACALAVTTAFGAEVITTTTTSTGTINEFVPGSTLVVKEKTGPVRYRYGKEVTYVTKRGRVLTDDEVTTRLRVGSPVSVHYGMEDDARVVRKVEFDDDEAEVEVDDVDDDD